MPRSDLSSTNVGRGMPGAGDPRAVRWRVPPGARRDHSSAQLWHDYQCPGTVRERMRDDLVAHLEGSAPAANGDQKHLAASRGARAGSTNGAGRSTAVRHAGFVDFKKRGVAGALDDIA